MSNKIHKSVSLIGRIALVVMFVVAATMVILSAAGYRLELTNKEFVQTAMIAVKALPRNANLTINGQIYEPDNLWRINNLNPGRYDIEVSKPTYNSWEKTVTIEAGQNALYEDVILFLTKPTESPVDSNTEKSRLVTDLNNQKPATELVHNKNEIYFDSNLVTRYSSEIFNAQVYSDNAHVTFISGDKFHVIDLDGSNDNVLFDLKNDSKYILLNGGQNVLCLEGDKLRMMKIR